MKRLLFLYALILCILFMRPMRVKADCCPVPPQGYDCFTEAPASLTGVQIETKWSRGQTDFYVGLTHVVQFIRVEHPEVIGFQYEVQYTDDLFSPAPQWMSYARWTATRTDIAMTDIPVYDCVPFRFFRVIAQAPAPASKVRTLRFGGPRQSQVR